MSQRILILIIGTLSLTMAGIAQATLIVDATVHLNGGSHKLIYDTDLNITWLDYSSSLDTWSNQVSWADDLSVVLNGTTYDDWRLPQTVDGDYAIGYDGTTTAGWNITNSEMGYLFYMDLGNLGHVGTDGNIQPGSGLLNTGPFDNLLPFFYWSGTEYANDPLNSWHFSFDGGDQYIDHGDTLYYALPVHQGRIIPVPEPTTMLLFGTGLAGLAISGRLRKRRTHTS